MGIDSETDRREVSDKVSGETASREDERSESSKKRAGAAGSKRREDPGNSSEKRHASREDERSGSSERNFPGVPESDDDDEAVRFPDAGSAAPRSREGSEHARDGAIDAGGEGESCSPDTCTCGEKTAPAADADSSGEKRIAADGAGAANVDETGELGDIEFTEPAENVSQDVYDDAPDTRVGVPEGVDLDTPEYSIRSEMNDIETPDEKTWFMELDEAVIGDGRCIQCGTCVAACPSDSIGVGEDDLPKLVKMCTGCSLCWDFCPRGGLRYERQWKITGGDDNVKGAGDPITEFSATVEDDWTDAAQDGGVVTGILATLLEEGEIDGALIATESEDEPWKAESFLATTEEELIENAGTVYNQTLALGNLDLKQWEHKLPDKDWDDLALALVGTPCEIEGLRALQDFEWDYQKQNEGIRAVEYTISLMCTKNFNYYSLIGEQLEEKRDVSPDEIGKMDVLHGKLMVYDHDGEMIVEEDVENFHDAALKGCDECADFTGFCSDITVGSVGSSDEYSSVILRTEQGMNAWDLTEPKLDYHDLEDKSAVGKLQGWDKKKAFESLARPFDPDAPRFIDYTDHAENYGTAMNPHDQGH
ncbi:Coenzyme F420 hydrogenase/dehydrogenase, beta subunit C-terminal domain [Natronolimnohabitans innermongolicus]|uniref:Coenzyme F420 hydrogenase n=1 Tax=Natronolimnohabitans innermongolicus JCM 12255 TaxID=1227499 RepID=L9X337_9EURY|nr:Coenzyme F420 hydrogenase/dehydrogenase, beta subunit C-terminal domain [Natronolimnohabitans innermongolicus]ELY55896.1 Coenzyme F420 hydrogenase [Natronolimnohabitans innermongolicus JCM 12255]